MNMKTNKVQSIMQFDFNKSIILQFPTNPSFVWGKMFSDLTTPLLHLEVFLGLENSQLMQASSLRCKVPKSSMETMGRRIDKRAVVFLMHVKQQQTTWANIWTHIFSNGLKPTIIWMFPKIVWVLPPNHSIFNRVFHYFHHPFWGVPTLFLETPL